MKLATTTGDFSDYLSDDLSRVRALHAAGFRYIDLSMYSFHPGCVYMGTEWREAALALKKEAERLGVTFVQAHSQGGNALSRNAESAEFVVQATLRSIEICQLLGIPNTVVHCGFGEELSKEEYFEKNRVFYQRLLPTAERCGVNVLIENSTARNMGDRYFVNSGADMVEFLKFVDHPMLHACWDTGHGNCEGAQYDELLTLGKELYAIHYNDNRGGCDEHVMPYLGTLNNDEIIAALKAIDYKGCFTLECDASLITGSSWPHKRRPFDGDSRLLNPPLFLKERMEALLFETAKYILDSYGLFEE